MFSVGGVGVEFGVGFGSSPTSALSDSFSFIIYNIHNGF